MTNFKILYSFKPQIGLSRRRLFPSGLIRQMISELASSSRMAKKRQVRDRKLWWEARPGTYIKQKVRRRQRRGEERRMDWKEGKDRRVKMRAVEQP